MGGRVRRRIHWGECQIPLFCQSQATSSTRAQWGGAIYRVNDWGDTFAAAVNGIHLKSPLGLADITLGNTAWSAKTVKSANPLTQSTVRLISGRNSPIFSSGSQDFFSDVQETGNQVLQIWNARVEEAAHEYPHLRTVVLIRNMDRFRFRIFEFPTVQFDPADYEWAINTRGNLGGS